MRPATVSMLLLCALMFGRAEGTWWLFRRRYGGYGGYGGDNWSPSYTTRNNNINTVITNNSAGPSFGWAGPPWNGVPLGGRTTITSANGNVNLFNGRRLQGFPLNPK